METHGTSRRGARPQVDGARRPTLATVSRHDPLVPYLHAALAERYPIAAHVDVELTGLRRAAVGALTARPGPGSWGDRYMKSTAGYRLRSRAATRGLAPVLGRTDVVIQTHALFRAATDRTIVYVDCTYLQAERGWPGWTPLRGRPRGRWLRQETALYRAAAHLVTLTDAARTSIIEDYGVAPERVTTVGAGVNFYRPPQRQAGLDEQRPTVLFVGKDYDRKGGDLVLEAFARARRTVPDARLQVVGCVPPGPLPAGVEVLGRIEDRARMAELYAHATVFCLASRFDPAPLVVLEAMSHGLPSVLSRDSAAHVGSVLDEGGGLLAPTGEVDGLVEGLRTYLQSPERARQAGAVAQRAMAQRYRWSDVVARMAPAIDAVAAQRVR